MNTNPAAARRASVLVASDWAPIRAFDVPIRDDPERVYGDLLPILRRADLRVVNCECALTRRRRAVWKSGSVFKGEPAHVRGLTAVPFDIACLANNHVLDYGIDGLRETLEVLDRHGIRTVGAGLTEEQAYRALTVHANGLSLHVVNVSEGEDLTASRGGPGVFGWDLDRAAGAVRACRARGGAVLVVAHCGLEYIPHPPPYVVAAFRALVEAGASAVVGHHPHVLQGVEWYRGAPLIYSLGNFVFYQAPDLYYRKLGAAVTLRFEGAQVTGLDLHPYHITETGLRALDPAETRGFTRLVARISRPLDTPQGVDGAWQAYLTYYGRAGFTAEVQGILARLENEPARAAAMFRNRITTAQHVELWRDFLTRTIGGEKAPYSRAAYRLVEEYFTKRLQGSPPSARSHRASAKTL